LAGRFGAAVQSAMISSTRPLRRQQLAPPPERAAAQEIVCAGLVARCPGFRLTPE
jgi:hypothetical protein